VGTIRLPVPPTLLVGRDRALTEARALLLRADVRLLTLTGPPGIGKTRLAIEVGRATSGEFEDGVVFADLAPLTEPALVLPTIARILGIRPAAGQPLLERLAQALRDRELLLVLDNFEHLLDAAVDVGHVLEALPDLKLLATSREPLRLRWEHQMVIPPLAVPDLRNLPEVERLTSIPSVALLLSRAKAADHAFQIEAGDARAVAEICVRLDGLPLALELAAPALKLLTPQSILERLDHRLSLLSRAARDLPERHRTLRAAVGWSYALLTPHQQAVFRALGVFTGGWTVEAAAAVCVVAEGELLETLSALVDKSLVEQDPSARGVRFRMLETIREFALEQLDVAGDREDARGRHARFFLERAEGLDPGFSGPARRDALDQLEAEHDNIRSALSRFLATGTAESALRLAGALCEFWALRGHWTEGRTWVLRALEASDALPLAARARAFRALALLAWILDDLPEAEARANEALAGFAAAQGSLGVASALRILAHVARERGEYERAARCLREGLQLYSEAGHRWGIAVSLSSLALVMLAEDRPDVATEQLEESLSLYRESDDPWGVAVCLSEMGRAAYQQGRYPEAADLLDRSLAQFRELGDKIGIAGVLADLGAVARALDRRDDAGRLHRQSLALRWELGSRRGVADCLEGLAAVAADPRMAARWLGAAQALRRDAGAPLSPAERAAVGVTADVLRAALGDDGLEAAQTAGRAMPLQEAVREALSVETPPTAATADPLTPREHEIAGLVALGLTNREIAQRLYISRRTADAHVQHILNKLGLHSRAQIAAWTTERRITGTQDSG
jgi:predicted ATPase/DNA-binding CsgD family transcriptional regulator